MNVSLSAMQAKFFVEKTGFENFIWGLLFGGYILTIVFYLLFWFWTKESIHKLYIFYISVNFLSGFFTGGWPIVLFENLTSYYLIIFLGIFIALSIYTGTAFSSKFIDLESKIPRFNTALNYSSIAAAIIGVSFILGGYYHFIMPFIQGYSVILIVTFMASSIYYSFKGDSKARYFLFAFSFFYAGIIWRYLRNTAVIEPNFLNENIYQIAAFVHMIVMSVGIFANYNQLKKDKNRAEIRAQAEAKLRLEQREFLSLVSHEFRTPLTIAGVSADNLLQQTDLSKESRHRVEKIIRANERISSLMDSYLSKERLIMDTQDIRLENNEISEICRLAINDMPNPEKSLIKLTFNEKIFVNCDAGLIRIAINNLIQNALKFSPEPGSIELQISTQSDFAFITISDKGPGIPEDEIPMIFARYYRGKNSLNAPGAGLGLHIIQTIILRHGGSVSARNLKPNGCEFSISIPL
jgi:signal transduction histidine kinase